MKKYAIHPTRSTTDTINVEICDPKSAHQWSVYTIDNNGLEHWMADFASQLLADEYLVYLTYQNGKFPNGITSYLETHHEVVEYITLVMENQPIKSQVLAEIQETQGSGGIWAFAEQITDEFEQTYAGTQWDGDWQETLWPFIETKLGL